MFKKLKVFALITALLVVSCIQVGTVGAYVGWELVWEDQFNGTAIDTNNWWVYDSVGHAGNGIRTPNAVTVSGGYLNITAQMVNGVLNSGGIQYKQGYPYGKLEFRVRVDEDPSTAVSGVVLTWPTSNIWPADGENDIWETATEYPRTKWYTNFHCADAGGNKVVRGWTNYYNPTQWHTVILEWEAGEARTYVDGTLTGTMTNLDSIPDKVHAPCIQLDAFKTSISGICTMQVDYIKYYRDTNRAWNGLFESGNTSFWSCYGTSGVNTTSKYQGTYGIYLGKTSGAEQVITGLLPNTNYTLSAYVKTAATTDNIALGVKDYGGTETSVSTNSTTWTLKTLTFTTGVSSTSAKIYLYRNATGTGNGYGDRIWLIKQ